MNGVTLGMDMTNNRGTLNVVNGLTLANNVTLTVAAGVGSNATINFNGTQTLGGSGTLLLGGTAGTVNFYVRGNSSIPAAKLTIGPGVTMLV